jgi:hypothetical protein
MKRALVCNKLFSEHSVVKFWITPYVEESRHFFNGIQLKKHMQKIPMKFNLLKLSRELGTKRTSTSTNESNLLNAQSASIELQHNNTH